MLWIRTEVAETKRVEAFHDAVKDTLAHLAVDAPVGLLSKRGGVVVLHGKGHGQARMLAFLEVEPARFGGQATRQAEVWILVDAHGHHDGAKASEFVRLGMQNVPGLNERRLNVSEVGLSFEAVNGLEFGQIGPATKLEAKPLNDRSRRLEVDLRPFGVEAQGSVIGDVLLERDLAPFLQAHAPRRLTLKVSDRDGHVAAAFLEPAHLVDDHRMPKVHLPRGHESRQDTEGLALPLCIEDPFEVAVSEDDATTVQPGRVGKVKPFHAVQPEPADDALVVGGLSAAPRINLHASTSAEGGTRRG